MITAVKLAFYGAQRQPWHAIRPDATGADTHRTYCGRPVAPGYVRGTWEEHPIHRCRWCAKVIEKAADCD